MISFIFALKFLSFVSMKNSKPSEEYRMRSKNSKSLVRSIRLIYDARLRPILATASSLTRFFATKIVCSVVCSAASVDEGSTDFGT